MWDLHLDVGRASPCPCSFRVAWIILNFTSSRLYGIDFSLQIIPSETYFHLFLVSSLSLLLLLILPCA